MANDIQATFTPRVGVQTDTFEIAFSAPTAADQVTVQINELDTRGPRRGRVTEGRGGSITIATFTGTIASGQFRDTVTNPDPVPAPAANQPVIKVRFTGQPAGTSQTLPIPASTQANENGVFEIGLIVTARIGGRRRRFTMPQPVFLRNFRSGRPEVAFVTGSGGSFFSGAQAFWERHADGNFPLTNVLDIREFLRTQADARGFGPWGDVNIVSHGNAVEWFIRLIRSDRRSRHLRWWDIAAHRSTPPFTTDVRGQLDARSRVIIRGCAIGNDSALLDEIRRLFGGQVTVKAPKFLQFYHSGTSTIGPREGFFEFFSSTRQS